jgi:hypothetical protein
MYTFQAYPNRYLMQKLLMLFVTVFIVNSNSGTCFPIVNKGKATAGIVIPGNPSPVVKYAAEELRWHIHKATGVNLLVISENDLLPGHLKPIYVGPCKEVKRIGIQTSPLNPNAFKIQVTRKAMYLVGKDGVGAPPLDDTTSQGSLFAVYHWLERNVHVKWLWPGELGTVVPKVSTMDSGPVSSTGSEPRLKHARFRMLTGDWAGVGGERARQSYVLENNVWLRRHRFVRGLNLDYPHAFNDYWKRFSTSNPDFFAMNSEGRRTPFDQRTELVQLCVSNKNLHKQIIADWTSYRSPVQNLVNGNENDKRENDQSCHCDSCKAWDSKVVRYAPKNPWLSGDNTVNNGLATVKSDRYAKFYLALQAEAQKIDPNAEVIGLAYADYTEPPVETKLNGRVFIRMVPAFQFPLSEAGKNSFMTLWKGWANTGASLILRPNYTLEGYCLPYIYARQFGEQFKYALNNGLMATDFDSMTGMWGVNGPTLYMIGRLNDSPDLTVDEVLTEYYSGFGKAADAVRSYFDYWAKVTPVRDEGFRKKYPAGGWSAMSVSGQHLYTEPHFSEANKLLAKALELASDEESKRRVKFLVIWFNQAKLAVKALNCYDLYKASASDMHRQELDKAKAALDEYRMSNLSELGLANLPFLNKLEKWAGWRSTY